jgi:Spy/CpxP family protein refolding chaperone
MNARLNVRGCRLLAGGLSMIVPLLALAGSPAAPLPDGDGPPGGGDGHFRGRGPDFGDFDFHEHGWGWGPHPAFLEGLKLTEEQEDKVFAILHAAAPALREQAKAARKAHEGLDELGTSPQYDEARAKALTDAAGKAESQLALLHIRAEHDVYSILTAEQRAELAAGHKSRAHEHDGGPPAHP